MIRARETNNLVPYTAKNTLDFIRAKFVKTNANTTHIAWTKILLHTHEIGQAIYQWQASFDPLIRAFEQARTKKMRRMHVTTVKQLIAKQITDNVSDTVFTVSVYSILQHYSHSTTFLQHSCLYAFSILLPVFYILLTLGMDSQFIYTYCIMIGYYQSRLFRTSTYLHKQPVHLYLDF